MSDIIGIIFPSILCCYTCFLFYSCNKKIKKKKKEFENKKEELINLKKQLKLIDDLYDKYLINTEFLFDTGKISIENKMELDQKRKKLYNIETYSIRLKITIIEYELLDREEARKKIINQNNEINKNRDNFIIKYKKEKKEYLEQIDII